jgi:hypothetical protein
MATICVLLTAATALLRLLVVVLASTRVAGRGPAVVTCGTGKTGVWLEVLGATPTSDWTKMHKPGDILPWDRQGDPFGGRYKLIAPVEGEHNTWVVEDLPPDDDEVDRMINLCDSDEGNNFFGAVEDLMQAIAERSAGRRSTVRLVSQEEWAELS